MLSSAILIAAGGGTQGDDDPAVPPPDPPGLIPLFDRPLVAHVADELVAAGTRRIVVLADQAASSRIAHALADAGSPEEWLSLVEMNPGEPLADALREARSMLGAGPFLVRWADAIRRNGGIAETLPEEPGPDAVALTSRWLRDGGRELDPGEDPRGAFHVGVYLFARDLPPAPERLAAGWLDDALTAIEETGAAVERRMVDDWWRYRGQPAPELDVNHFALEGLAGVPVEAEVIDSELVGAIRCDPSATIRGSVIRGPVVIGADAVIDDAFIGPFSSIGAGATIEGAEIENSVVRERSVVADLGTRLESSVIGPDATIARDFRLPRGARLSVGRGARISL